ncbi:MAG TPA: MarR family winged helix-turn-helix transcriptional regulator [Devosia sp.]|nr:MarR family winged helix-turn-helix transcriptional regulator [Devosia sp.]
MAKVSDADYAALAAFRRSLREFAAFSEEAARRAGLTPHQHQALLAIRGSGTAPTIGALAGELLIRPHSALELVDRLVAAGLVERQVGSADRRRVELTLTAKAEEILAELSAAHLAELRQRRVLLQDLLQRLDGQG